MLGAALAAGALIALAVVVTLSVGGTGDYQPNGIVGGDNPAPAIGALVHGDIARLLSVQPVMGLVSLLIRAPVAALAAPLHWSGLTTYQLGALVCLLPGLALVACVLSDSSLLSRARLACVLGAALILLSPATHNALWSGHPEEPLAAVLATASVVAAQRQARGVAAVCLGLAVGTKQWAVVAALPVLVALDRARLRAALIAGAVALAMSVPAMLDPSAFAAQSHGVFGSHLTNQFSAWWFAGAPVAVPHGLAAAAPVRRLPFGLTRSPASLVPLAVLVGVVAWLRRARPQLGIEPLALLALLELARCLTDPLPLSYYYVPVLISLAAYEAVRLERVPILTACVVLVQSEVFGASLKPSVSNVLMLIGAAALVWSFKFGLPRPIPSPAWRT